MEGEVPWTNEVRVSLTSPQPAPPGKKITGTLLLVVVSPFTAEGISLTLRGIEKLSYQLRTETGQLKEVNEESELLRQEIPVSSKKGALPVGRHELSFAATMPSTLAGSLTERCNDAGAGYNVSVTYELTAAIPGAPQGTLFPPTVIQVAEGSVSADEAASPSSTSTAEPVALELKASEFKSALRAGIKTDRSHYQTGDRIVVSVDVTSTLMKATGQLNIKLVNTLTLSGGARVIVRDLRSYTGLNGFGVHYRGVRCFPCDIPSGALPSCSGSKISSTYAVVVSFPAMNLEARLPVIVNKRPANSAAPPMQAVPAEVSKRVEWVSDGTAHSCSACGTEFTLIKRRHHCRNCGKVFCGTCTPEKRHLPDKDYLFPVRVCATCLAEIDKKNEPAKKDDTTAAAAAAPATSSTPPPASKNKK